MPFLVTDADETEAAFSPDGKWIPYSSDESGRRDVYLRDFAPEPGPPRALFKTTATGFFPYDVAADGRFLVNTLSDTSNQQSPITVVLNWQSRLKK